MPQEAALCQTLIDMGHTLASRLPEAQPLASLLKGQEHDFKGASQALAQIWQVSSTTFFCLYAPIREKSLHLSSTFIDGIAIQQIL